MDAFHPLALNEKGELAGSTGKDSVARAALWQDGRIVPLPTPKGATRADATALNNAGDAVGEAMWPVTPGALEMPEFRAVLWRTDKAILLDDAIPAGTGWRLEAAHFINNRGEVIGTGTLNGVERTYLLRPIPRASGTEISSLSDD
jgi:hypothetical protein